MVSEVHPVRVEYNPILVNENPNKVFPKNYSLLARNEQLIPNSRDQFQYWELKLCNLKQLAERILIPVGGG